MILYNFDGVISGSSPFCYFVDLISDYPLNTSHKFVKYRTGYYTGHEYLFLTHNHRVGSAIVIRSLLKPEKVPTVVVKECFYT